MNQSSVGGKGIRMIKTFLYAFIIFLITVAIFGLLIRFTPSPERWSAYYMLISLSIACFFIGLYAGNMFKKRGVFLGMLFAALFLMLAIIAGVLITGEYSEAGLLQARYLICLICGGLGGIIGVNLR